MNNSSLTRSLARTVSSHYQTASNGPKEKERETIIAVRSHSLAPTFFLYTHGFYHLCTPLFTRSLSLARSRLTLTRSPESSPETPPCHTGFRFLNGEFSFPDMIPLSFQVRLDTEKEHRETAKSWIHSVLSFRFELVDSMLCFLSCRGFHLLAFSHKPNRLDRWQHTVLSY